MKKNRMNYKKRENLIELFREGWELRDSNLFPGWLETVKSCLSPLEAFKFEFPILYLIDEGNIGPLSLGLHFKRLIVLYGLIVGEE